MSGTSLDAIDVAGAYMYVNAHNNVVQEKIYHTEVPYPEGLKQAVLALQQGTQVSYDTLLQVDAALAEAYYTAVTYALDEWKIPLAQVTLVANHGQTIYHKPSQVATILGQFTLQLGNLPRLAFLLKQHHPALMVMGHFREADCAAGGQGAPLVPFYDALFLKPQQGGTRVAHNLGGISNVTVLPSHGQPFAFDTGVANIWMDAVCQYYFKVPYDAGGELARKGHCIQPLFNALIHHPFHKLIPPKSTGRDDYNWQHLHEHISHHVDSAHTRHDILFTTLEATAYAMAQAYSTHILPRLGDETLEGIVFSGGGAENVLLLERFTHYLNTFDVAIPPFITPEQLGVPNKAKEALAFALLGWAKALNLPSNVPSCTGASAYISLGLMG
jgi:anhydro-N-acetylmuramic acid kinase